MNFRSKKISLVVLAVLAIICSRTLFFFFNDTEGPNLLIVGVLTIILFIISFACYAFTPAKMQELNKLSVAVGMQLLSAVILYLVLKK